MIKKEMRFLLKMKSTSLIAFHMDKSWADLPAELLRKIFQSLFPTSLLQVQLTCIKWDQVACQVFYKDLSLFNKPKKLTRSLPFWASSSRCALHSVRKLRFNQKTIPDAMTLSNLVSLCPFITEIEQHGFSTVNYFPALLKLREEGYLQHLQLVEAPSEDSSQIQDHNNFMLAIADTATRLTVFDKLDLPNGASTNKFPLLGHISKFTCLKELHFFSEKPLNIVEAGSLIQGNHPYLKRVEFLTLDILHDPLANTKLACNASQVETVRIASEYASTMAVRQIMAMFPGLRKVLLSINSWEFHPSETGGASEEDSFDQFFCNNCPSQRIRNRGRLLYSLFYVALFQKFEVF